MQAANVNQPVQLIVDQLGRAVHVNFFMFLKR